MLLSSLLGPVKPPVARREDLDASAGLHRVVRRGADRALQAVAATAAGAAAAGAVPAPLVLAATERCLVCLCEYAVGEQVRRLGQCGHVYHQECIDTVCPFLPVQPGAELKRKWLRS